MDEKKQRQRFWRNKQIISSFLAGMAVMLILIVGVTAAVNPGFLTGTVKSQADIVRYRMFPDKISIPNGDIGDKYVGELTLFSHAFTPSSKVTQCDGKVIQIDENNILYTLLGDSYGGDSNTNSGIPDLRNRFSLPSMNYYINTELGIYPMQYNKSNSITKDGINYVPSDASNLLSDRYSNQSYIYVGEIVLLKVDDDSKLLGKFIPCEGQKLETAKYQYLFASLLGAASQNTPYFTLPDLRNLSPIEGAKYYIANFGSNDYNNYFVTQVTGN